MRSRTILKAMVLGLGVTGLLPATSHAALYCKLQTPAASIAPGDTFTVEVAISYPDNRFNAFDADIRWDTTRVAFVPTTPVSAQLGPVVTAACANQFHHFNAYPDSVRASVGLLCNQVFITKIGAIYKVRFRALAGTGPTTISFGAGTRFYEAGVIVDGLTPENMTVMIGANLSTPVPETDGAHVLETPRPNPLRAASQGIVTFRLPARAPVTLDLFDTLGRRVAALDAGEAPAGITSVRWDLPGLPAGRYEVRLRAAGRTVGFTSWVKLN